jgi:hypothetical protein
MRKKQMERMNHPSAILGPTMDRTFSATTGYSGFIPGKDADDIVGCTFANTSALAHDIRGKHYKPPLSGVTFTLTNAKNPLYRPGASASSLPPLQRSGSAPGPLKSGLGDSSSPFKVPPLDV